MLSYILTHIPTYIIHTYVHKYIHAYTYIYGVWGGVVVKALRYWSDGPGIDSRWCHWGFFPWFPRQNQRSTEPLKVSTRVFSWGKGGPCVWLTTYHPCSVRNVKEIRDLNLLRTPWATSACRGRLLLFF